MKHLQKFDSFSNELNENIFQDSFEWVKSKLKNLKQNISSMVIEGINIAKENASKPEIQELVVSMSNLSEEDKAKMDNLVQKPELLNGIVDGVEGEVMEGVNFDKVKNGLLKFGAYSAIFGSVANLVLKIVNTPFLQDSMYRIGGSDFLQSNTFATLLVIVGLIIGAYLLSLTENDEESPE